MKHLIYFFLLFSTVVFSQNYDYAIEEAPKKTLPVLPMVNNQLEEIEYFKAYLLPIAQKANLQKALDTYGAVRLEKGDYSGFDIVMHSNQRLYGHPSLTKVSNITIAAGSSNVYLVDLFPAGYSINFQAGGVISNCTLKSIKWCSIVAVNAMLENNTFIDMVTQINFNCTNSGYFRNNKIIRHQSSSISNMLVMKGNAITPSYGNVNLWSNYLTPHGDTTDIDGLQSATFVGVDAEGWNLFSEGKKAMFTAKNMGNLKITEFQGGSYNPTPNIAYDIDATNLTFYNRWLQTASDIISARTNVFLVQGAGAYSRGIGTATGFDLMAHNNNADIIYNENVKTSAISNPTDITKITNSILETQHTPWNRPNWETLPDPLGANWKAERVGKPDSRDYIQNLIDTNNIVDLPEGIFYIGSTLNIPLDSNHGIVGSGTGKTAIVGLTDNFPLITLGYGSTQNFKLDYLTLQGGSVGVYSGINAVQIANQNINYVVFRNQNYGIQLHQIFGMDNCFFNNVSFVNCNIGIFKDPLRPWANDVNTSSYIDKTVFYKNQFLNCNEAVSMRATRADNLNAWVGCKFDNNNAALNVSGQSSSIVANCDFTNNRGSAPSGNMYIYTYKENAVINGDLSYYSCNFNNNSAAFIFNSKGTVMEGCNLLDNIPSFANIEHNSQNHYIINSTINGAIGVGSGYTSGVFVNSNFLVHPEFSKILVNLKKNILTTIIDKKSNPYPQVLVTQ